MSKSEIDRLSDQVRELKRQLHIATSNNHKRNLELDALHYVWCNGGCEFGTNRWGGHPVTQDIVDLAVRNTERLKQWYGSKLIKEKRKQND